jgi:hypothetical protein
LLAKPDPLLVAAIGTHTADQDGDGRIGLYELLRVIELYNTRYLSTRTGAYREDLAGEDGFAPDYTRFEAATPLALARRHSADSDRNGRISLLEVSRVIELFNYRVGTVRTGEFHRQTGTEDGFAPGPAAPAP